MLTVSPTSQVLELLEGLRAEMRERDAEHKAEVEKLTAKVSNLEGLVSNLQVRRSPGDVVQAHACATPAAGLLVTSLLRVCAACVAQLGGAVKAVEGNLYFSATVQREAAQRAKGNGRLHPRCSASRARRRARRRADHRCH